MAKKKRSAGGPPTLTIYEPDPKAMKRMAAEQVADTMMRVHPKMKRVRNHIVEEVEKAANRAMGGKGGPV